MELLDIYDDQGNRTGRTIVREIEELIEKKEFLESHSILFHELEKK